MSTLTERVGERIIPSDYIIEIGDIADAIFTMDFSELTAFTKKIQSYNVVLSIKTNNLLTEPQTHFTSFDRYVHDAIISIYEGFHIDKFTLDMAYRVFHTPHEQISTQNQQYQQIPESIKRLSACHVEITITDKDGKKIFHRNEPLLDVTLSSQQNKSVRSTQYSIDTEPILLSFAKVTKTLVHIPISLFLTDKNLVKNRYDTAQYLLRKIASMIHNTSLSHIISFVDIYQYIWGNLYRTKEDTELKRVREYTLDILNFGREKHFIDDYSIKRNTTLGRKYSTIEIIPSETLPIQATIQNDLSVIIPQRVVVALQLQPGDIISFSKKSSGEIMISKQNETYWNP